jgi:hypothetical protein
MSAQKVPFPDYALYPFGDVLLSEADWNVTFGYKWGVLLSAGATVTRDTNHGYGGSGAAALLTGNTSDTLAEVKTIMPYTKYKYIALELKWIPGSQWGANKFEFGIEPRTSNLIQGRMRYTVSSDEWEIETGIDTYESLDPAVTATQPVVSNAGGAGDEWGWARLEVDVINRKYNSFMIGRGGGFTEYNLEKIPLVDRGVTVGGTDLMLFFALGITGNTADTFYTTDWVISGR